MKWSGWIVAIIMGVLYMRASTINKAKFLATEKTLSTIEKTTDMKMEVFQDLSNRYEGCLNRVKKLNGIWRRKISNYRQVVALNKQRIQEWQRKEKPLILAHFSQAYRKLAGLEKSTIPYKLAYLTSWVYVEDSPMVLKLNQ